MSSSLGPPGRYGAMEGMGALRCRRLLLEPAHPQRFNRLGGNPIGAEGPVPNHRVRRRAILGLGGLGNPGHGASSGRFGGRTVPPHVRHPDGGGTLCLDLLDCGSADRCDTAMIYDCDFFRWSSTSCACPLLLALGHTWRTIPSASTRTLDRMTPADSLPYIFLIPQAPYASIMACSGSLNSSTVRLCFS